MRNGGVVTERRDPKGQHRTRVTVAAMLPIGPTRPLARPAQAGVAAVACDQPRGPLLGLVIAYALFFEEPPLPAALEVEGMAARCGHGSSRLLSPGCSWPLPSRG